MATAMDILICGFHNTAAAGNLFPCCAYIVVAVAAIAGVGDDDARWRLNSYQSITGNGKLIEKSHNCQLTAGMLQSWFVVVVVFPSIGGLDVLNSIWIRKCLRVCENTHSNVAKARNEKREMRNITKNTISVYAEITYISAFLTACSRARARMHTHTHIV